MKRLLLTIAITAAVLAVSAVGYVLMLIHHYAQFMAAN